MSKNNTEPELRSAGLTHSGRRTLSAAQIRQLTLEAKAVVPCCVSFFAERMGVSYGRICIRHQKTRWGSCSSAGNLNFNCLLMLTPREVLEYVVVHELAHRKHMDHSPAFWKEVENVLPDYRDRRKWLKDNGWQLICLLPVR